MRYIIKYNYNYNYIYITLSKVISYEYFSFKTFIEK